MSEARIEQAIQRIEAALNRIDAAARDLAPRASGDSALENQHRMLRQEVSATLRDLDQLIEGLES